MPMFRFRPREIEAVQFDGRNWVEMTNFTGTRTVDNHTMPMFNPIGTYLVTFLLPPRPQVKAELYLKEHQKHAYVEIGDWVVKRDEGDFWLCKDDIFQKLLEPVEETSDGLLSQ